MKQVSLLPSGCQTWHKNILGSGGEHFVYASTLATYTHEQTGSNRLCQLQTAHERTITSLSWQPNHPTAYATAATDMRVVKWSATEEKEQASVTVPNIPVMIDWSGHASVEEPIAILLKPGRIATWDPTTSKYSTIEALKDDGLSTIRWNLPTKSPVLALGRIDGSVLLYDWIQKKVVQRIEGPVGKDEQKPGEVIDIQWDPLSNHYFLVAYKSGLIALLDSETGQILQEFSRPIHEPNMITFVPTSPGDFLSINTQSATLTLWNVSQAKPKEVIKVDAGGTKKCGMLSIKYLNSAAPIVTPPVIPNLPPPSSSSSSATAAAAAAAAAAIAASTPAPPPPPSSTKYLLAYMDGAVAIYDYATRHIDFITTPAHSETIFDVRFKPSNPDTLATASYDSTIKIWNVPKQSQLQELKGQNGVLYGISWCPGDESENRLASGGSEGDVFIWDAKSGQILLKSKHHSKPVYGLKWHPSDKELLVSTSSDNYAVVFTPAGKILKKLKHPAAAYGCDWNPFQKDLIATGCHDGIVRVFDVTKDSLKPIHELAGHTARVFNTIWSPLLPTRLASGSDDKTIRVWDISTGKVVVLQGHTHNVRAIAWSTEVPYLLLTGAWDGTIRIWDIRDARCLHVIDDHHADIYGLASHPLRPFSFVSSSRDTSLRFWSMDDTLAAPIKIEAILADGLIQPSQLGEIDQVMKPGSPLKLCGPASLAMIGKNVRDLKDLERYAKLFDYFTSMQGVKELWRLLEALVNNKPSDPTAPASLIHVNDVRPFALQAARTLHQSKNHSTVGIGKRSDRLLAAANAYLALGHVREYCEIQIELGEWHKALAIAPAASMSYWKLLTVRHGFAQADAGDHQGAALTLLASGETKLLLAEQVNSKDIQGAFVSAVCESIGALPLLPPFEPEEEKKFNALVAAHSSTGAHAVNNSINVDESKIERDNIPVSDNIRDIAEIQANYYFSHAQPVLAACALLRVGDAMGCVEKLVLGNELLLAMAVCRVLKLQFCDDVFLKTGQLCEELGLYDEALKCLVSMRDPKDELILLAARFQGPANKKAEFYLKVGIRSQEAFAAAAETNVKDGKRVDALIAYVASGQYEKTLTLGLDYLRELFSLNSWSLEEALNLIRPLNCINLEKIANADLRTQFLIYSYFIGAQVAMNKNYPGIVTFLFESIQQLLAKLQQAGIAPSFPLPLGLLRLQEASYLQSTDPTRALNLLKDVLSESNLNAKYKTAANLLKKTIETVQVPQFVAAKKVVSKNLIIPSGSYLPTGGSASKQVSSIISRSIIVGPRLNVDQPAQPLVIPGLPDGAQNLNANHVALSEALMLVKCTPYSPNHTGQRLKVFAP